MFGYIIPDKMNMYIKDFGVFRAYYCGLCKSLGKTGAPITRFCTSYDMTFLSALIHSLKNVEPTIKTAPCILSPFKKKSFVACDDISRQVADVSILLSYFKIIDDIIDGQKGRIIFKPTLYFRMRKAKKHLPKVYEVIKNEYHNLRLFEKNKCDIIEKVAEPFANMLKGIIQNLVPESDDNVLKFAYHLGKLVYLFDGVDDVLKDSKKKRYNPFLAKYGIAKSKKEFLEKNRQDIEFLLKTNYNILMDCYDAMKIKVSEGVLSNIIYLGIDMQISNLLKGEKQCEMTRL